MPAHHMAVLGITAVEEEVYRLLLRSPGAELSEVHVLSRQEPIVLDAAVRRLRELHVLREDGGKVWPHTPDVVVNRLAQQRLEELYHAIRTLSDLRPIVDSLTLESSERSPDAEHAPVERLIGLPAIRERLDELAFFARSEILACEPYDALTPENIESARPLDLRCLRRGVVVRNLVRASAVADDMCTVSKDETGARQVGTALRTYRRYISELIRILGAENRAHAALLARERGWI
ncbi:hypothetical protein ACFW9D_15940 [Streptomyces sp. NPDC059524]|uniref:hypothetical protein n=1 Tax=Streptomyces sp. NPDC059524 TaxID=3346856 RepID=UPI0036A89724